MRARVNPASTGLGWVRQGVRTFFRQPLAMSGLFFMFMAAASVLSLVPLLGTAVSVALVPAATLGLMAATREAQQGRFPMPSTLVLAFRGGPARTRAMLTLGAMYAAALLLVLGASVLLAADPGAAVAPAGEEVTAEAVREAFNRPGLWVAMLLYLPVLMAFWHAPALVYWHGVSPGKSLFFSLVACWSNKAALFFFTLGWLAVFMGMGLFLGLVGALLGGAQALNLVLYPVVLFMASMFHTSIWFTFVDSFAFDAAVAADAPHPGDTP